MEIWRIGCHDDYLVVLPALLWRFGGQVVMTITWYSWVVLPALLWRSGEQVVITTTWCSSVVLPVLLWWMAKCLCWDDRQSCMAGVPAKNSQIVRHINISHEPFRSVFFEEMNGYFKALFGLTLTFFLTHCWNNTLFIWTWITDHTNSKFQSNYFPIFSFLNCFSESSGGSRST